MKYTPNDLDTGDVITNVAVDNWDAGIVSANNSRRSDRMNLLSDTLALCEDGSLWTNFQCTDSDDTENAYFGKSAIKSTLTASSGFLYYDAISKFSLTSYYLVYAYVKNSDLSGLGARIKVNVSGGGGDNYKSSYSTSTDYTRVGVILQPSDLTSATNIFIYTEGDGASSEEWWTDGYGLIEITASEYAEGATALLAKFPFTYSKGQDSYTEINTLGADTVVSSGRLLSESGGLTDVNLFDDDVAGCESTSGWTQIGTGSLAIDATNKVEGINSLNITASSSGQGYRRQAISLDANSYYLVSFYNILTTGTLEFSVYDSDNAVFLKSAVDITNTSWTRTGFVISTASATTDARLQFKQGNATAMDLNIDALMLKEITAEEYNQGADAMLAKYDYHRGLGSCEGVRVKSVGKNLHNGNAFEKGSFAGTSLPTSITYDEGSNKLYTVASGATDNVTSFFNTVFKAGEKIYYQYERSTTNISARLIKTVGGAIATLGTSGSYTPAYDCYLDFYYSGSPSSGSVAVITNAMVSKSAITEFEPYKESISYTPRVLRSVPNGTRDSYRHNDGVYTQNCEEHVLLSGDIDSVSNGTHIQFARINLTSFAGIVAQTSSVINGSTSIQGFKSEAIDLDDTANEYKWYTTSTILYLIVPLGTWADVAAARTALTSTVTTKIVYQLATPVTTYHPENIVVGYPNGTIYHEILDEYQLKSTRGMLSYGYPISTKSQIDGNTEMIKELSNKMETVLANVELDADSYDFEVDDIDEFGLYDEYQIILNLTSFEPTPRTTAMTFNEDAGLSSITDNLAIRGFDGTKYYLGSAGNDNLYRGDTVFEMDETVDALGTNQPNDFLFDNVNGVYLCTCYNDVVYYSTDSGATWTAGTASSGGASLSFDGTTYFCSGSTGGYSSTDGITWTSRTNGGDKKALHDGTNFVGIKGTYITDSADGITWTLQQNIGSTVYGLHYNDSLYVAVGASKLLYTASTSGGTWTAKTPSIEVGDISDVTTDINGKWIIAATNGYFATEDPTDNTSWVRIETDLPFVALTSYPEFRKDDGVIYTKYGYGRTIEDFKFVTSKVGNITSSSSAASTITGYYSLTGGASIHGYGHIKLVRIDHSRYSLAEDYAGGVKHHIFGNNIHKGLKKIRIFLAGSSGTDYFNSGGTVVVKGVYHGKA